MAERKVLGGTDGLRGVATTEHGPGRINEETFTHLAFAAVRHQQELGATGPVGVAQDTRCSGDRLRQATIAGAVMAGAKVHDLLVAPTPVVQKWALENSASIVFSDTASHNPKGHNGIKYMPWGEKPSKEIAKQISGRYWDQVESGLILPNSVPASETEKVTSPEWYLNLVTDDIESQFGPKPLEGKLFVVDGAYGAAQNYTPEVLHRLGAEVKEFCCDGQGDINDGCGAADLGGLENFLRQNPDIVNDPRFVGAIANDGDADRIMTMGVVTDKKTGERRLVRLSGNQVMGAHAQGQPAIVGTEYTNTGLRRKLDAQGIGFGECANGDTFVTEMLRERGLSHGGEFTGHHVDLDWVSSGDGVHMAAWLSSWAVKNDMDFGDIYQEFPLWPEKIEQVEFAHDSRTEIKQDPEVKKALDEVRRTHGDDIRVIVRPSGTEELVRVWAEATEPEWVKWAVGLLGNAVRRRAKDSILA